MNTRRQMISAEVNQTKGMVGVIDVGTNSVAFIVYSTPDFKELASHRTDMTTITPADGWFEQDARVMMDLVYKCCNEVCRMLPALGFSTTDVICIGITNARETTIAWDSCSGRPLYHALVWKDIRSSSIVDRIASKFSDGGKYLRHISGLPLSPYFSALKMRWLKDYVPAVRKACLEKRCKFGTIDSWIVYNLTKGTLHITDVTNASRTMLMNIETLHWDPVLLRAFSIDVDSLPKIRSCSEIYGKISNERSIFRGVPITGIVGNQQAALLGQMCFKPGMAKNTYRSGCFLLCNTGRRRVISSRGLLTTVAYKLGPRKQPVYALEGSVAVAGHALNWLENRVRIMQDHRDAEKFASNVTTTGDVYFVPAFTGLYAPYWRKDARGIIIGLTQYTTKYHIARAALEAICFQTRDILECMYEEGGIELNKLYADGILSTNNLLMQLQADTAGVAVYRSQLRDTTTFGAALCAAQSDGIKLLTLDPNESYSDVAPFDQFLPKSSDEEREIRYAKWKRAVERSMNWVTKEEVRDMTNERYRLIASIPAAWFVVGTFAMVLASKLFKQK